MKKVMVEKWISLLLVVLLAFGSLSSPVAAGETTYQQTETASSQESEGQSVGENSPLSGNDALNESGGGEEISENNAQDTADGQQGDESGTEESGDDGQPASDPAEQDLAPDDGDEADHSENEEALSDKEEVTTESSESDAETKNTAEGTAQPEEFDVSRAADILFGQGPLRPQPEQHANIVDFAYEIIGQNLTNQELQKVELKLLSSGNSAVAADGTITYGDSPVEGQVTFALAAGETRTQGTVLVVVPSNRMEVAFAPEDIPEEDLVELQKALDNITLEELYYISDTKGMHLDPDNIIWDIQLPDPRDYAGVEYAGGKWWSSTDDSAIKVNTFRGKVLRDDVGGSDKQVSLVLTVTKNGSELSKTFDPFTVKAVTQNEIDKEKAYMQTIADALTFDLIKGANALGPDMVTQKLDFIYSAEMNENGEITWHPKYSGERGVKLEWTYGPGFAPYGASVNRPTEDNLPSYVDIDIISYRKGDFVDKITKRIELTILAYNQSGALSSIKLDNVSIGSLSVSGNQFTYETTVSSEKEKVSVEAFGEGCLISINGSEWTVKEATAEVLLETGVNVITILSKAPESSTEITYTLTIVKPSDKTVKVTSRIEEIETTISPKTEFLTQRFDLTDYGVSQDSPYPSVLHLLIQTLESLGLDAKDKDILNITSSGYIVSICGIGDSFNSWMYSVNGEVPESLTMAQYALNENDNVVFFCVDWIDGYITGFDREEAIAVAGEPLILTLTGVSAMDVVWGNTPTEIAIADANILIGQNAAGDADMPTDIWTGNDGKATLLFENPGTYYVSAVRYNGDSIDITRPFCVVEVAEDPKEGLGLLLDECAKVDASLYTAASYQNLRDEMENAQAVYEAPNVSKEDVLLAIEKLQKAKDGLKEKGDHQALGALLEICKAINGDLYTLESYQALQSAIEKAQAVYDETDADKETVDSAIAELTQAKDALDLKAESPADPFLMLQAAKVYYDVTLNKALETWWDLGAVIGGYGSLNGYYAPDFTQKVPANALPTDFSGQIMGVLALSGNPYTSFSGQNLVKDLASKMDANGYFHTAPNQQAWAIIALNAAKADESQGYNKQKAVQALMAMQQPNGSFAGSDDGDITSMVLIALSSSREIPGVDTAITKAVSYLKSSQNTQGAVQGGWSDNANTTASVISGLVAAGEDVQSDRWTVDGKNPLDALKRFQLEDGFAYKVSPSIVDAFASSQSIIALGDVVAGDSVWNRIVFNGNTGDLASEAELAALKEKIAEAEAIDTSRYTDSSVRALNSAVAYAKEVAGKQNATKTDVSYALSLLLSAVQNLTEKGTGPSPGQDTITVRLRIEGDQKMGTLCDITIANVSKESSVFDVLLMASESRKFAVSYTGSGRTAYVKSINGLAEFDNGSSSGWIYKVNNVRPELGCGRYILEDNDYILWTYTDDYVKGDNYKSSGGGSSAPKDQTIVVGKEQMQVDDQGNTNVVLDNTTVAQIIEAIDEQGKDGTITIDTNTKDMSGEISVALPSDILKAACEKAGMTLDVVISQIHLSLNESVTKELNEIAGSNAVQLSVKTADLLAWTEYTDNFSPIGGFELKLSTGNEPIGALTNGNLYISLPYSLDTDMDPETLAVYWQDEDGLLIRIEGAEWDSETQLVSFYTNETGVFLLGALSESETAPVATDEAKVYIVFTDIDKDGVVAESVLYLYERNIVNGRTADTFSPNQEITRAEFLTMLARISEDELPQEEDIFEDVKPGSWYTPYVLWAVNSGLVEKESNFFEPAGNIAYEEMKAIIAEFTNYMVMPDYQDQQKDVSEGPLLRGEAAVLLAQLMQQMAE